MNQEPTHLDISYKNNRKLLKSANLPNANKMNTHFGNWVDESNLTWLHHVPKIKLLPENDKRHPYPLSWEEQDKLFEHLASHLKAIVLFAVNTGCRDTVICSLKWERGQTIPELGRSVFNEKLPSHTADLSHYK